MGKFAVRPDGTIECASAEDALAVVRAIKWLNRHIPAGDRYFKDTRLSVLDIGCMPNDEEDTTLRDYRYLTKQDVAFARRYWALNKAIKSTMPQPPK